MHQQNVRLQTSLNQAQAKNQQQMLRQLSSLHQKLQMQQVGSEQPPHNAHPMQPQSANSLAKMFRDLQQQERQQLMGHSSLDEVIFGDGKFRVKTIELFDSDVIWPYL